MSYPIIFLGTPEFAAEHLKALIESSDFEVRAVVSQPDRPAGRKMHLQPSAVKKLAVAHELPVLTPESAKDPGFLQELKAFRAEAAVVVAYGQILTEDFLKSFDGKVVNVHGSLLPRWRGAAPIQRAIMEGDQVTGVSLQVMVKKLDAGDVLGERKIEITDDLDALDLLRLMTQGGKELLLKEFKDFLAGKLGPHPQDESQVTYAHKIEKSEAEVDWNQDARIIFNRHRGLQMGPGTRSEFKGKGIKFKKLKLISEESTSQPGVVLLAENGQLHIGTGNGVLAVESIQPESRSSMDVKEFLKGYPVAKGDVFGK